MNKKYAVTKWSRGSGLLTLLVLFVGFSTSNAQTLQEQWWSTNGTVNAIEEDPVNELVYLGGSFDKVGIYDPRGAELDITTAAVTTPMVRPNGTVYSCVPDGSGGWFIGGNFTEVGGVARQDLAHINADGTLSSWDPNCTGGVVYSIFKDGTTIYAAGSFSTVGGVTHSRVAAIDANTGVVSSWNPGTVSSTVYAISSDGTNVYIGGQFTSVNGTSRNRIAAIDAGTAALTSWNPNASSTVRALLLDGSTIYVGGQFTLIGGGSRNRIAELELGTGNATSWDPSSSGTIYALAKNGSTVYVGGSFSSIGGSSRNNVAGLDESTGLATAFNATPNGIIYSLAGDASTVFVGGTFTSSNSLTRERIMAVDATTGVPTSWDPGAGNTVRALALAGSKVYAGGDFLEIGWLDRDRLAAFDMNTGQPTSWDPGASSTVNALSLGTGTIFIGGAFTSCGGQSRIRAAEVSTSTGLATSWNPGANSTVYALANNGSTVFIGGAFGVCGGLSRSNIAAIDAGTGLATSWDPVANGTVRTILLDGSTLYLGGQFTTLGGVTRNRIGSLNISSSTPNAWNPNANNQVYALAVDGSTVYAGGVFTSIGGQSRNRIAALDASTGIATTWNPSAGGQVNAIAVSGSSVFAGGAFTTIGGQTRTRLGELDASTGLATAFFPLPSSTVNALSKSGGTLIVGGAFSTIAGSEHEGVAAFSTEVTYYSQASGNVSDPIWDIVPVGTPGPAVFSANTHVVIQNGHTVTQDIPVLDTRSLTTDVGSNYTLPVTGLEINLVTSLNINQALSGEPVVFNVNSFFSTFDQGGNSAAIGDTRTYGIHYNDAVVNYYEGGWKIEGEITASNSNIDLNGHDLTLVSDATGTALIGPQIATTWSNAGNVTMERHIPAGVTNWRNLGTCMTGATLEDWDDDFFTSGIPNSDYPVFIVDGENWPSIYLYDEVLVTTPEINEGFVAPTDMNNALVPGEGYWVWCGDQLSGTNAFTIDVTGTPNMGPVNIPLDNSITGSSTPPEIAELGWNMVANPLPAPVDFTLVTQSGPIENRYWVYDPVSGNTALWDEGTLSSLPGGILNGNIQSSQGLWIHANGTGAASLTFDENAKIDDASANGVFGGFTGSGVPSFRLEVSTDLNSYYDEVMVRFSSAGTPGTDPNDALKLFYNYPGAPMLSTLNADDADLTLNDMGQVSADLTIPVRLTASLEGEYTLLVHDLQEALGLSAFVLEDLQTGEMTPLTEGATYTFNYAQGDLDIRFLVHAPAPEVALQLKAFLEGPYDESTALMADDLRAAGLLPTTEPFTALGFQQVNGGGETVQAGVFDVTGPDAIVDWVLVELRDKDNSSQILSTTAALLQRDGDIVSMDGISPVSLVAAHDDHFVALRHRNHLGAMTLNAIALSDVPITLDFSNASVPTYGTEARKYLDTEVFVLWAGNAIADDRIKYTGLQNDRDPILIAIGGAVPTASVSGYLQQDLNLDGDVRYTGANNDRDPILVNIGGVVPTQVRFEQLP